MFVQVCKKEASGRCICIDICTSCMHRKEACMHEDVHVWEEARNVLDVRLRVQYPCTYACTRTGCTYYCVPSPRVGQCGAVWIRIMQTWTG
jgi:hypothetical protein